jgi:hypothetical protein
MAPPFFSSSASFFSSLIFSSNSLSGAAKTLQFPRAHSHPISSHLFPGFSASFPFGSRLAPARPPERCGRVPPHEHASRNATCSAGAKHSRRNGFALSLVYVRGPFPLWLRTWLCITYGLLFLGEFDSWWIPYAFGASPSRVERYQSLFSRTHSFLPSRQGIVPNTLHVILHAFTLSTVILALCIVLLPLLISTLPSHFLFLIFRFLCDSFSI